MLKLAMLALINFLNLDFVFPKAEVHLRLEP